MSAEEDKEIVEFFQGYYGFTLILIGLLFVYLSFQAIIEHKKFHLLHETGFGMLLGFTLGLIIKLFNFEYSFSGEHFFQMILPPIIFAAGYNLKKKKFFTNFYYISLYAIIGTLISFIITLFMAFGFFKLDWIVDINGNVVNLNDQDLLYYGATMCASDTIAALTLINSALHPKLFSLVFGEGLLNDAMAIILFKSVGTIVGKSGETKIDGKTILNLFTDLLRNCSLSVLVGFGMALFAILVSKKFRCFMEDPIKVNIFLLLVGYSSYCIGELIHASSVIALLTSGVLMNHYMRYNLTEAGRVTTSATVSTLSQMAEAFLFVYLGLSSWTYISDTSKISISFITISFLITIVARFGCIYLTSGIAFLLVKKRWNINRYEMSIIWFSGLIRGAVAFALIQIVESKIHPVIVSTILFVVFFTTVTLGAVMSSYVKFFTTKMSLSDKVKKNEQRLLEEKQKRIKKRNGKLSCMKRFDEQILKPLLIYDYQNRKENILKEKQRVIQEELDKIKKLQQDNQSSNGDSFESSNEKTQQQLEDFNNQQSYVIEKNAVVNYGTNVVHSSQITQIRQANSVYQSNKDQSDDL